MKLLKDGYFNSQELSASLESSLVLNHVLAQSVSQWNSWLRFYLKSQTCTRHCDKREFPSLNKLSHVGYNPTDFIVNNVVERKGKVLLTGRSTQLPVGAVNLAATLCIRKGHQHNNKSHCHSHWLFFNPLSTCLVSTLVSLVSCWQHLSWEISHADHVELLSRLRYYNLPREWHWKEENK